MEIFTHLSILTEEERGEIIDDHMHSKSYYSGMIRVAKKGELIIFFKCKHYQNKFISNSSKYFLNEYPKESFKILS